MIEVDATASQPTGKVVQPYQGKSVWGTTVVTAVVCAILSIGMLGWFYFATKSTQNKAADLQAQSTTLDQEISTANKLKNRTDGKTVETRAQELVQEVTQFKTVMDGRQLWGKLLPELAIDTLQGITLNGMSIDAKLAIKISGSAVSTASGTDKFTSYGMVARQIVAYQNAEYTPPVPASPSTSSSTTTSPKAKVFSTVTLTGLSKSVTVDPVTQKQSENTTFSVALTLNPDLLKIPVSTSGVTK